MSLTPSRRVRSGLVLLACLAAVIAMLALPGKRALAADGCTGPFTIGVSGPNGSSTIQPAGQQLHLTVLAADGSPASTQCPLDGKPAPSAMHSSWGGPSFDSYDSVDGPTAR